MSVPSTKSAGEVLADISSKDFSLDDEASHTEADAFGTSGDDIAILEKFFSKATISHVDYYKMDFNSRGHAVIVNNENFHPLTRMNKRTGTDVDAANLKRVFKKLGFKVEVHKDLVCRKLIQLMEEISRTDHTGNACFVFAILSHGDDGCIYGTDGTVEIKLLVDLFRGDICRSLAGKPKIFFFQACRGTQHEIPVLPAKDVVDGQGSSQNVVELDAGLPPTLPSGSDFLFCYSVVEGFYSHRDTLYGSWYVQEFTSALETLVFKNDDKPIDFLDVLTLVNRKVANRSVERSLSRESLGKKQMPCYLSMLTKKLYLMKKSKR